MNTGDVWRPHQRYLDERPPQVGSKEPTTCPGSLKVVGPVSDRAPFEVECSECGFSLTVTKNPGPPVGVGVGAPAVAPKVEQLEAPKDDIPF